MVAWLEGATPYVIRPELEGFVFKYPPWAVPPLFWIGLFPFGVSAALWLTLCLGMLAYAIYWLIVHARASTPVVIVAAFLFWWIWLAHASAGQFTMLLLGAGLWARASLTPARSAVFALTFGAKVFPLASGLGVWRELVRPRAIVTVLGAALALHAIYFGVSAAVGGELNPLRVYSEWMASAASGSAELGALIVRGQGNHGFSAMILRQLDPEARALHLDFVVFAALTGVLGWAWARASRGLDASEAWAGWLALGVVVLPLAWHHSFVVAFPLCALALDRALKTRSRYLIGGALLGTACIGILIPQVIGPTFVRPLELAGLKSWGVVIAAATLVAARQRLA